LVANGFEKKKMNQTNNNESCERADDLISVLYGEANEREALEFQQHLQLCTMCQTEMTSFGQLRESIDAWKVEALSGFTTQHAPMTESRRSKSAFVALREFFDLSPLWLKGVTAFAALLFVVFAVIAFGRFKTAEPTLTSAKSDAIYTEEQKNVIVQKALEEQKASLLAALQPKSEEVKPSTPVNRPHRTGGSTQLAKGRRPLSRWEREQLAADLRLLQQSDDDDGLELLSDRINK
jgi:hypothetical protein